MRDLLHSTIDKATRRALHDVSLRHIDKGPSARAAASAICFKSIEFKSRRFDRRIVSGPTGFSLKTFCIGARRK